MTHDCRSDVHAGTIIIAVAESAGHVRTLGPIPSACPGLPPVRKPGPPDQLRVCCEAGPTGHVLDCRPHADHQEYP